MVDPVMVDTNILKPFDYVAVDATISKSATAANLHRTNGTIQFLIRLRLFLEITVVTVGFIGPDVAHQIGCFRFRRSASDTHAIFNVEWT